MNLVFLDFDGVLNSHKYLIDQVKKAKRYAPKNHIDPENVRNLNDLCQRADAQIVISSSWRHHGRTKLAGWLRLHGLEGRGRVIGTLASGLPRDWVLWRETGAEYTDVYRGLEIEAWMLQNITPEDLAEVRAVILDDDSDFGRLRPFWIRTTFHDGPDTLDPVKYNYTGPYNGLQAGHVEAALKLFEAQKPEPMGRLLAQPNPLWSALARDALYHR